MFSDIDAVDDAGTQLLEHVYMLFDEARAGDKTISPDTLAQLTAAANALNSRVVTLLEDTDNG